ncbi:hypothetical protein N24_1792 [Corynebacterium suranareeae]|uniref:Uncharacterized protein n=1 Tax=Corynebacterium suranareeae TaxID=2506452 RepID=A0A160PR23_9CORY|nr:hypothetical protein [Corynebacterium suranareeae]BAU96054.1 hypothetical protein N24_1792 [Corynebacterium suranareeae]
MFESPTPITVHVEPKTLSAVTDLTVDARELAELLLSTTDYRVFYMPRLAGVTPIVSYLYVSDGENFLIVGRSTYVPWEYYVHYPIKPSREFGSAIAVPLDESDAPEDATAVVALTKQYMQPIITPGASYMRGFYNHVTFDNHLNAHRPLTQIISD